MIGQPPPGALDPATSTASRTRMKQHKLGLISCALLLAACPASRPACTPESLEALKAVYTKAAEHVIDSGACDPYTRVEDCPEYRVLEQHYLIVGGELCAPKK